MQDEKTVSLQISIPELGYSLNMNIPMEVALGIIADTSMTISQHALSLLPEKIVSVLPIASNEEEISDIAPMVQQEPPQTLLPGSKRGYPFTHDMFRYSKVVTYQCPHCKRLLLED